MDTDSSAIILLYSRDIRFSNDKSPYKSQFACFFSRGGKKVEGRRILALDWSTFYSELTSLFINVHI